MLSKDRMPAVHWLTPAPFPFCVNIRAEQRKKFSSLTILRRFKTVQNRAAPKKQKIVVETGSTDWKTSELLPLSKRNKSEPNADWRGVRICCFFDCYEATYFRNGVRRRPTSKLRGPRKKKTV